MDIRNFFAPKGAATSKKVPEATKTEETKGKNKKSEPAKASSSASAEKKEKTKREEKKKSPPQAKSSSAAKERTSPETPTKLRRGRRTSPDNAPSSSSPPPPSKRSRKTAPTSPPAKPPSAVASNGTKHRPVVRTPPPTSAPSFPRPPSFSKVSQVLPTSSQEASSSSVVAAVPAGEPSLLLVEKYKPINLKGIIGQQGDKSNMRKLVTWIQNWEKNHSGKGKKAHPKPPPWGAGSADNGFWAKAALLSGPPGVGKTTTAYLVSKDLGYDVMELNASDTRSKKLLEQSISDAMSSTSLSNSSKKRILLMDEVDGMAGNEDRGGMAELIQLIKHSKIPVICMCNDRNHQKIRSLAGYCFDLRFHRPRADQIKAAMMSVCFKEKIKISPDALTELIVGCNQDIRQVMHHLTLVNARDSTDKMEAKEAKEEADRAKKTSIKVGPFDVVRKVFSASEQKGSSLFDKSDLFFQDYSLGPLFAQECYLSVEPTAAKNSKQVMELVSKAADSFCDGDLIDATIRSRNSWNLLPVQAMFSSVIPGEYMSGYMKSKIEFPVWFGKYSKQNKFDRMLQELQTHTRLSSGVAKRTLNQEMAQPLRDAILRPMRENGSEGVDASVNVMKHYSLLREDLDNLLEVCQWPDTEMPLKSVDSKVKAAFTRQYNKEVLLPYSSGLVNVGRKRSAAVAVDELLEDEEGGDGAEEDDDEDEDDISKDSMIKAKVKKPSKAKAETVASQDESGGSSSKGGKGSRGGKRKK